MTNNEFIAEVARRIGISTREATNIMEGFVSEFTHNLEEEDIVAIQGFGSFSVKKKLERVAINPSTKQRMLIPPKIVINFKVSPVLRDKIKGERDTYE